MSYMEPPPTTSLVFTVRRREPELVAPVVATPRELKRVSDIDDQECFRFQIPVIQFYKNDSSVTMQGRDPVRVIREALSRTLVFYYPFAGRLRELGGRKLAVDCTGEGVIFIEADADVALEQFGVAPHPPFPYLDQLLYDVPASGGILHCPLLLIQVTRLKCGGFIFAIRLNHVMADATGLAQFLNALGEMSRGVSTLSISPVWERELLNAKIPPRITCTHHEYDEVPNPEGTNVDIVCRFFFFGRNELSAIRKLLPHRLHQCTKFEILTAYVWRCRTIALRLDPKNEVRALCVVNARTKFNPPLPTGYYGNVVAYGVPITTAGKLVDNPLSYALELVKAAKRNVTQEYVQSVASLMVIKGRPHFKVIGSYLVSSVVHIGFGEVDYGWGKALYGGQAMGGGGTKGLWVVSFHIPCKNQHQEEGILIPVRLPALAMERFQKELHTNLITSSL